MGGFTPGHLWFILFLFLISWMALPLLLRLRGEAGQRLIGKLATFFSRPGAIFLAALPLTLAYLLPDIGGKRLFYYLVLFVYGYVLVADRRFGETLERHKTTALVLGVGTTIALIGLIESGVTISGWLEVILGLFHTSFVGWFFLIAFLGFGCKYLDFGNRMLRYASEAAYPFYILHQTVIVIIGFYVTQWNVGVLTQFVVIVATASVATFAAYELVVKRIHVMRFLFGMKPQMARRGGVHQSTRTPMGAES
jgi:hypothetical protein